MINNALRLVREFHNINQTTLSDMLGISRSYLSEIESGKKPPSIDLLKKYGELFDTPPSSLLLFSEKLESNTFAERTRVLMGKKIIKIMDWLVDSQKHWNDSVEQKP